MIVIGRPRLSHEIRMKRVEHVISALEEQGPMSRRVLSKSFINIGLIEKMLKNDIRVLFFPEMSVGGHFVRRNHPVKQPSLYGIGKKSRIFIPSFYVITNDERVIEYIISKIPWRIDTNREANSVHNSLRRTKLTTCQIVKIIKLLGYEYGDWSIAKYSKLCGDL